ncbi:MAG: hypothetical protein ABSA11_13890 [Candidatus Bathyarchaeia archaeon]
MVKDESLKKRAIYVYPPTQQLTDKWKTLSSEAGVPISKFVIDHVQNSLSLEQDENYNSRTKLIEENTTLRKEINEKDKRIGHLELLVEKLEEDLQVYRSRVFTEEGFKGKRTYDKRLVEVLREPGLHTSTEILGKLGVNARDTEVVKGILSQIENLHEYGLIRASGKGWTWKE